MVSIVLVGPETPGNIGAVARSMKNFDLKELVLVAPKCDHLSKESLERASHAKDILKKAKIMNFKDLDRFDYKIATTAILGTDYNIPRSPLSPEELGKLIAKKSRTALLIGRESHGLTNKEIGSCDFVVTIPSSKKYPTINVSHAAAILFYELFKSSGKETTTSHFKPASGKDKETILKSFDKLFDKIEFATPDKKQTQKKVWKRIIGKSFLTKREAFAVLGLLRKLR